MKLGKAQRSLEEIGASKWISEDLSEAWQGSKELGHPRLDSVELKEARQR